MKRGRPKKNNSPTCFGKFGETEANKCNGCKFMIGCYGEWRRNEKIKQIESRGE